ncbi:GAF domain-containing protein [Cronbergia sp. UHCC 0137]|uniref:GAF domain-containing protein n=1 Tax=Cronbergia sp. UHCC 0137 TaxID=3110239 RepID=UPI002B200E74|nr:GAF domain-containing protein [Cronbergia sp. UHCC 0137]MEA5618073.1 GAF domain-containing protein [Cronbergia sp. UHCC 0137]
MGQLEKPIDSGKAILSLARLLQSLREEDNVDMLIQITIGYIQEQFDYQLIWVALYDQLKHSLHGKGGIIPDGDQGILEASVVLNPGNLLEQVVIQHCFVEVEDLQNEPRAPEWQIIAAKSQIQGTVILPIRYKDNCFGVILLGSSHRNYSLTEDTRGKLVIVLGELGLMLSQKERNWQQKQLESPTKLLLQLQENLRSLNSLNTRLEAVVGATHQFISPSRTTVYWLEREKRHFWCRMNNCMLNIGRSEDLLQASVGITIQEMSDFYYALTVDKVVWVGESSSSLKTNSHGKLLQRLGMRSLLAAPIIWQKDLLGFLAVESREGRVWKETDKNFVQSAAGLLSLVIPIDSMETTIAQIQKDHQLTNEVAQTIYQHQDIEETLHGCATNILERLSANRFLLFQYNSYQNIYQVLYQSSTRHQRTWPLSIDPLGEIDIKALQKATNAIEIENWEKDLRLSNWRSQFVENGGRSLLLCNCTQGHHPELLLVITHEQLHSWTNLEKKLLWVLSQHIGVIVHNWQLGISSQQQQKLSRLFQQYFKILNQAEPEKTELEALKQIASVWECPLVTMLSWSVDQSVAKIISGVTTDSCFKTVDDQSVDVEKEPLIQLALSKNGYSYLKGSDLQPETKKWLKIPDNSQVVVIGLRSHAEDQCTGIILLVDYGERMWSETILNATENLVSQLAWWRHHQTIIPGLQSSNLEIKKLNWYKHGRLTETQRLAKSLLGKIHDLGIPSTELTRMHYKLLLGQLNHTIGSITSMIKQEQWQLQVSWETMSVSNLLRRSLDRVDSLMKQKELWISVHGLQQFMEDQEPQTRSTLVTDVNNTNNQPKVAIAGDIVKIELVIHELLVIACDRSVVGTKIDIWCSPLGGRFLELSITDHGIIEPSLLAALGKSAIDDDFRNLQLNQPPGLHLLICQQLMKQLGGELQIYQIPDHRVVSRLLLPLAPQHINS